MMFLTSSTAERKISHAPSISSSETTTHARAVLIPQTGSRSIWTATSLSSKVSSRLEAESRELPSPRQEQISIAFSGCAAHRRRSGGSSRAQAQIASFTIVCLCGGAHKVHHFVAPRSHQDPGASADRHPPLCVTAQTCLCKRSMVFGYGKSKQSRTSWLGQIREVRGIARQTRRGPDGP